MPDQPQAPEKLTPAEARELYSLWLGHGIPPDQIAESHPAYTGAMKLGAAQPHPEYGDPGREVELPSRPILGEATIPEGLPAVYMGLCRRCLANESNSLDSSFPTVCRVCGSTDLIHYLQIKPEQFAPFCEAIRSQAIEEERERRKASIPGRAEAIGFVLGYVETQPDAERVVDRLGVLISAEAAQRERERVGLLVEEKLRDWLDDELAWHRETDLNELGDFALLTLEGIDEKLAALEAAMGEGE